MKAIKTFPRGSGAGPDGLRPGHLESLLKKNAGGAGVRLASTLTEFVNMTLQGEIPAFARKVFYGASLCALFKKHGGIRPIAVGNTLRRLATKVGCAPLANRLGSQLRPVQLGFATKGGCEAAVHATRRYIANAPPDRVVLKLDLKNAFNCIRRDVFLQAARERTPSMYRLLWQAYSEHSLLFFGDETIRSATGIQQGDPMGPALFSLGVDQIARSAVSELNIWYLDDATLGGEPDIVLADFRDLRVKLNQIGLDVNGQKCELIHVNSSDIASREITETLFREVIPDIKIAPAERSTVLGAPISAQAIPEALAGKIDDLKLMTSRLSVIEPHQALTLLKNCFAIPKL